MNSCLIIFIVLSVVVLPHAPAQSIRGSSSQYPYEIGGNVSSPVKVILALLIFGMFLIAFFSLYLRRCLEDTSSETPMTLPIVNNQLSRFTFPCGLDRSVVESFPVFLYSDVKELKIGKGALECAVCISEFSDDERLRFLPKCHHVFHPDCIDAWLASHTTCPVCRSDLTTAKLRDSEIYLELTHLTRSTRPTRSTQSQIDDSRSENISQNHNLYSVEEDRAGVATRRFPRSHSTGHSLVSPGESCERYTLRLPEEVRKQIVTLKRAKSCGWGVNENSRRGGGRRWNPDRICGKSELWNCRVTRMPVFIAKTDSGCKNDSGQSSSSATFPV